LISQNGLSSFDSNYVYELPVKGSKKALIIQGYNGKYSHKGDYALDFRLKKGSIVCAAREGIVHKVEDQFKKGGPNKKYLSKGNYIIIKHSDGTYAAYWHLGYKGVVVKVGETVQKGDIIGFSGNTGYSSWPHLHFDVYYFSNGKQVTIPTKFETSKGIKQLKVYRRYKKPSPLIDKNEKNSIPKNFNKIEFHFQDASVPPKYHRSYSWIITDSNIRYVLDSYGTILKDTTQQISLEKWEQCKTAFLNCGIKNKKAESTKKGCTGGTRITIKTWLNEKENFSGFASECGGEIEGNLSGDTDKFLKTIKEGIHPTFYLQK
jgi:murein DD-endopeptidase MepM/ murein hydrolase activator NlpD